MGETVYFNGKFVQKSEALIPFNDRGFQFADGIYEVIKYYHGTAFRMNDHLIRLKNSLKEVRISFNEVNQLEKIFEELIKSNGLKESYAGIYLQITRGSYKRMHPFPENCNPTVCINSFEFNTREDNMINGIKVITRPDIRWLRCDIKSVSLLPNVLMMQEADDSGAKECIFIRNGFVTEATHSNVIGVKNGNIYTHPDSNLILSGITRIVVREICKNKNIKFIEEPISAVELFEIDELMVIGTGNEITPVIKVNDKKVGIGVPGPVTRTIQNEFYKLTYELLANDMWWKKYHGF